MQHSEQHLLDIQNFQRILPPPVPLWFNEELKRILPPNSYGEPQLRAVWGMDATTFRNGDPRAVKYIAAIEKITTRMYRRLDPHLARYEYFTTREEAASALNIHLLPQIEYKNFREVRLWGPPRWIIEQYKPAHMIDTPSNWEANRYADVYDKRTGKTVRLDTIGPFPEHGRYEEIFMVENLDGSFRDLDTAVLTDIRRRVFERNQYVENDHSDAQAIKNEFAAAANREEKFEQRIDEELEDFIGPSKYRLVEGNAWSGYAHKTYQNKPLNH